jgi:hypothetical protein
MDREANRAVSPDASLQEDHMMHRNDVPGERSRDGFDLDELLHPAHAFDHPHDVVTDPDLTLNEKRAILSSWASDACAVESQPGLRRPPGAARVVTFDDIVDALKALDAAADLKPRAVDWQLRKRRIRRHLSRWGRSRSGSEGSPLGA